MATATKQAAPVLAEKFYDAESTIGQRILKAQQIKAQIDALAAEYEAEKAALLAHAVRNNFRSLACGAVTFIRRSTAKWTYSTATRNAEALLKVAKKDEQENGIAVNNPTESLTISVSAKALIVEIGALRGL
jgi:hypothetical protein